MSENVAITGTESPAPVAESAPEPSSTSEIAADVLGTLEQESASLETPSEPVEAAAPPTEKELSAAAKFLLAKGHQAKKQDGRDVWLPYKTVEGFLDQYVEQHKGEWNGARSQLERERDEFRSYVDEIRQDLTGDPKAFLAKVAEHIPGYKAFLEPPAAAQTSEMPQPDVDLGDGSKTYSVQGIQKLIEWAVDAKMMPKVQERLKPWEEREARTQQEAQHAQYETQRRERVRTEMTEAQAWPMFGQLGEQLTPFQSEVLAELQKDNETAKAANRRPSMTLRQAYLEVKSRHLEADHNTKRASWLKELNQAPKATGVSRSGNGTPAVLPGQSDTRSVAAQVLADLQRA